MMNDITFMILKMVLSVCSALIAYYLIPYLKNKLHEDKYAQLLSIIEVAVKAAEQSVDGVKMGAVKKEDAIIFINHWMNKNGIKIDEKQLSELIEAFVFDMNKEKAGN